MVFLKNSNNNLCKSFSTEDDNVEFTYEAGIPASHPRGRRISSLGDEIYYTFDQEEVEDTKTVDTQATIQHQHSLEGYQLNKEKLAKIREKQATMPGWEGLIAPARSSSGPSPASSASLANIEGSSSNTTYPPPS